MGGTPSIQLTTFIRELELVKQKQPLVKTDYLVGQEEHVPAGGDGDRIFLAVH
jgi:hypothetical protein